MHIALNKGKTPNSITYYQHRYNKLIHLSALALAWCKHAFLWCNCCFLLSLRYAKKNINKRHSNYLGMWHDYRYTSTSLRTWVI
jgi:hypothetical protein